MVEYSLQLDDVFQALADATRRDIIRRVMTCDRTISELAKHYHMSFAAVAKHLSVLERAQLIQKRKEGRTQIVIANNQTIHFARKHLQQYETLWNDRYDRLEAVLNKEDV